MLFKIPHNFILLILIVFSILLLGEARVHFLDLNNLLYNNLSEQLTLQQIEEYFANQHRWKWVSYVVLMVLLYLKTTVLAWILAMGGFFYGVELPHKKYWQIALQAEFIFLIPPVVKIAWFVLIQPDFSLQDVQQFVPFSLQSILDTSEIPVWVLYPLQLVNVFEILYWGLLVLLFNKATNSRKGLALVASSYGPALFTWTIFIMFLTLNLS